MKKLILIDGNSILFRAYYATAYPGAVLMQSSKGVYTNAVFAFANMFEKIIIDEKAEALVAFDTKEPTKRHLSYQEYKAGRAKMPDELAEQIPLIHKYIELYGVKTYSKAGYEADDIIGTLAKKYHDMGYVVEIFSSDRDLLQLVDDNIFINLLKKGMKEVDAFDKDKLMETYNLENTQIIDMKALMGDQSDNIPGIPGIGEKTAIKLLNEYHTLENILANKHNIKGKLGERIIEGEDLAVLSKMLVTIDVNADLEMPFSNLIKEPINEEELIKFYQSLDLHSLVRKFDTSTTEVWDYKVIDKEDKLEEILNENLSLHFEFSNYNYHKEELWGVGISNSKNHYYITPDLVTSKTFTSYLLNNNYEKYTYDYKASKVYMKWQNSDFNNVKFDLLLAAYLINSKIGKEEFRRIVSEFEYDDVEYDEKIYGKGAKKALPKDNSHKKHIASKAKAIYLLKDKLIKQLEEQNQLHLLTEIEIPLSEVLASMEYEGLLVDLEELNKQKTDLNSRIIKLEQEIKALADEDFNVNSPKQLGEILFDKLKLPYAKKTKTGYSTNVDVLNKLKNKHPIINMILEYRSLTKLYSTYIIGIEENLFSDNKVHTIYTQALTQTGRLSSLEPNLQNIPIRTLEGKNIRKIFTSSKGYKLLGSDYSQIELRVLAHIAKVDALIEAFNNNEDIHNKTAEKVFHANNITEEQRRRAKAVNFGIIYGIGAFSLAEDIKVSVEEAKSFIDKYLEVYPEIKKYMEDIVKFAYQNGYVETIMKRRRYIPELNSKVFQQRAFGERTALNAPIQGSAADILKKAMIDLYKFLIDNNKKSKILLQVHDELILEVYESEITEINNKITEIMRNAYPMLVELATKTSIGNTWYDLD